MKYTKGKWEPLNYNGPLNSTVVIKKNEKVINLICETYHNEGSKAKPDEAEANAKLISKAPEMYEALKEISKAKGTYSLDRLEHASNAIRDMVEIANSLIKEIEF